MARHLVAAGELLESDPKTAYQHTLAARARAGRLAVVREAVGEAAYAAGEYAEALAELRAAKRMNGAHDYVAIMADCERALGRPDRALTLLRNAPREKFAPPLVAETVIVEAGARRDRGELEAALRTLENAHLNSQSRAPWVARLRYAYADTLACRRPAARTRWSGSTVPRPSTSTRSPTPGRVRSRSNGSSATPEPADVHKPSAVDAVHKAAKVVGRRRPMRGSCCPEVICVEQKEEPDACNEVVLRGRISGDPQERELPSGTVMVSFRVVIVRHRTPMTASSKQPSDWVECSAWGARVRKQATSWRDGDTVEVRGALRRRYFRAGSDARTSVEVEMLSGRLVRRARASESLRAATG